MQNATPPFSIDFIGVGAARAGTTWLYQCLQQHPSVCLSQPKELNFFAEGTARRPSTYEKGIDWYASKFRHAKHGQQLGEICPSYLQQAAAERIQKCFPNCKIIIQLRNPIDALYSMHGHLCGEYKDVPRDFDAFLEWRPQLQEYYRYEAVRTYMMLFPKDAVHFILYEDLQRTPQRVIDDVCLFLGIDTFTPQHLQEAVNTHPSYVYAILGEKIARKIETSIRTTFLSRFYKPILCINNSINSLIDATPFKKKRQPRTAMRTETRTRLREFYKESNATLGKLLQRDLSTWL